MSDVDAIGQAIGGLIEATDDLGTTTMSLDLPWEVVAAMLDQIRAARIDLQRVEAVLERHIVQTWKRERIRGDYEVEGVGVVTVRSGRTRKNWDVHGVAAAVVDAHMVELGGEVPDPWDVRTWLVDALHVDYARVTILRGLGLRAGDYCTETEGVPSVQITKAGR